MFYIIQRNFFEPVWHWRHLDSVLFSAPLKGNVAVCLGHFWTAEFPTASESILKLRRALPTFTSLSFSLSLSLSLSL